MLPMKILVSMLWMFLLFECGSLSFSIWISSSGLHHTDKINLLSHVAVGRINFQLSPQNFPLAFDFPLQVVQSVGWRWHYCLRPWFTPAAWCQRKRTRNVVLSGYEALCAIFNLVHGVSTIFFSVCMTLLKKLSSIHLGGSIYHALNLRRKGFVGCGNLFSIPTPEHPSPSPVVASLQSPITFHTLASQPTTQSIPCWSGPSPMKKNNTSVTPSIVAKFWVTPILDLILDYEKSRWCSCDFGIKCDKKTLNLGEGSNKSDLTSRILCLLHGWFLNFYMQLLFIGISHPKKKAQGSSPLTSHWKWCFRVRAKFDFDTM